MNMKNNDQNPQVDKEKENLDENDLQVESCSEEENKEKDLDASENGPILETEKVESGLDADSLYEENKTLKDTNLRLQAEFQNYRRRTEKEKSEIYKFANERIVIELLGVIDNFERALGSISEENHSHKQVLDGVEMIQKSFMDVLEKEGLQKINAVGEPFDPNLHHAVMTEAKEDCKADIVIDEFQVGYKLGEKVIRPSMVKVSC